MGREQENTKGMGQEKEKIKHKVKDYEGEKKMKCPNCNSENIKIIILPEGSPLFWKETKISECRDCKWKEYRPRIEKEKENKNVT